VVDAIGLAPTSSSTRIAGADMAKALALGARACSDRLPYLTPRRRQAESPRDPDSIRRAMRPHALMDASAIVLTRALPAACRRQGSGRNSPAHLRTAANEI